MKRKETRAPSEADLRDAQTRVSMLEDRLYGRNAWADPVARENDRLSDRAEELENRINNAIRELWG